AVRAARCGRGRCRPARRHRPAAGRRAGCRRRGRPRGEGLGWGSWARGGRRVGHLAIVGRMWPDNAQATPALPSCTFLAPSCTVIVLLALAAALHGYLVWRLLPALALWPAAQWGLATMVLASAVLGPASMMAWRIRHPGWSDRVAAVGFVFMGWSSTVFILTLLRELLLGAAWLGGVHWILPGSGSEAGADALAAYSAAGVAVAGTLITLLGWFNAR